MRHAVLSDSGPLYAAADIDDENHDRAHAELSRIDQEGLGVLIPYPILLESYTLVQRRLGLQFAQSWLGDVTEGSSLINPTPDDYAAAARTIKHYSDQSLTLFDTVLARLSEQSSTPVWSYDHHFDVMGVEVWR